MGYAQRIQQKKFRDGSFLASTFSAGGNVSITGSVSLPRKPGEDELADVHGQMLLEATTALTKRQLQEKLDAMGASLSFSVSYNRLVFSARALANHLDELLELIAHILLEPAFPQDELSVLKLREEANLAMTAQDTRLQAGAAATRLMYDYEHPNFEEDTKKHVAELANVTQSALREFHTRLSAKNLVCAAVGDIKPQKAFDSMRKHFDKLPHGDVKNEAFEPAHEPEAAATVATLKEKASIDYVAAIAARITSAHDDYPALILGMQILGNRSGFSGRLMQIVREKEGLTYGVYSYPVGFTSKLDGYMLAWGTFAPQLFEKGRASMLREIKRIVTDGATDEEVVKHRELFEARSRVSLSNSGALARTIHEVVADGRKLEEIDTFPKRILKLTTDEVNTALGRYIDPDRLVEAAAGPIEKL
jgi:zinc protease